MRRWRWIGLVGVAGLPGCSGGSLDPHGPVAAGERQILIDALVIMLTLIVPVLVGTAWVAWKYRASNKRAEYRPNFTFSGRLEILFWSVPTLIITFLGGLIWYGSHELDPYRPIAGSDKALDVQVVAMDWKWLFLYPEQGVASVNEMVIPAGRPVHLSMTSASVMNTFWVPQLAGMIYVMNGMVTQLNFLSDGPGVFEGRSGHFSGEGFSDMHFQVRAVPADAFGQWAQGAKGTGTVLDRAAYEKLETQGAMDQPQTFRSVADGLFDQITTQAIPPAAGPQTEGVHSSTAEK